MHYSRIIIILFLLSNITLFSQNVMIVPRVNGKVEAINHGSQIFKTPLSGTIGSHQIDQDWNVVLKNYEVHHHTSSVPSINLDKLKQQANDKRHRANFNSHEINRRASVDPPVLNRAFRGNMRGNSVPMDNSMAISTNGFIVSGINTNVIFTQPDGKVTYAKGLSDFFTLLGLGTRMYDPRVIYDIETNRFIFMCLHGSEPSNTFLCLAFSKTEDPNGEWNYYKIDGNPSGDSNWFDYPNIALSNKDFYIAGLMRNIDGDWQYSVLYQIDKNDGYNGAELQWKYYNELKDADNQPSFNLVPTLCGWNKLLTPGMYFVSNNATGGNTYNLYYTDGSLHQSPALISLQTIGFKTELAPDGRQPNTSNVLNTFDSRIWSAMYQNGTIHMGSHINTPNGDVGLFYGRMNVSDVNLTTDVLTIEGRDMAFPSFSSLGSKEEDEPILVNYLISGPDKFPSQEQRICYGQGDFFDWSDSVSLKVGTSYIDVLQDNNERWGDYTTSSRRFFDNRVESWVTGCFGESGSYGTWLGQLISTKDTLSPYGEFVADKTTTQIDTIITFKDITQRNPASWQWSFPGGSPSTSNESAPKIKYAQNGIYDVTLIVSNDLGIDTITKSGFIHIQDMVVKPTADFSVSADTIFLNDSVIFNNLSSTNAVAFKWTFINGSPSSSTERNPVITYNRTGSHIVSLSVSNIAGSNAKIKQKAVTVLERSVPTAVFKANKTVAMKDDLISFSDLSTGGPRLWDWYFEGGIPEKSSDKDPLVTYPTEGKFDVILKVSNDFGKDSITINDYISIGQSSTSNFYDISEMSLFPNPIRSNEQVTLQFKLAIGVFMQIALYDAYGNLIKTIYNDKVKAGKNELMFNTYNLAIGQYYLNINKGSNQSKIIPLVIIE